MPNNKFQIDITARDRTREGVESASRGFSKLAKHTPLEGLNRGLHEVREKFEGLSSISRTFRTVGDAGAIAGGGISEAAGGMSAFGEAAGVAGLATAGVVAGLGVAATAAYEFEEKFTKAGAATGYLAQTIGMSAHDLQTFQLAAEKVGVSTSDMGSALQNVGNVMNDARFGRNQSALALLTRLNIQIKTNKDGSVNAGAAINDLADAMVNGNAQTKQMIASQFGLTAVLPFLLQGIKARQAAEEEASRSSAIMTDKQIADSQKFQASVAEMDDRWKGLKNTLSEKWIIPWLQPTVDLVSALAAGLDRSLSKAGALERLWSGKGHLQIDDAGNVTISGGEGEKPKGGKAKPGIRTGPVHATSSDLDAMARAIYTEADSEGPAGQAAVAHVILNRAKEHFGGAKTISDVVNAKWQFEGMTTKRRNISTSDPRYQRALAVAEAVMAGKIADPTGGADHYLNPDLQANLGRNQPAWAPGGGKRIGRHVFYGGAATDAADPQGSTPGVQLADAGKAPNGSVTVDVTLRGAPPGTIASVSANGKGISAGVKIAPAMQGAA